MNKLSVAITGVLPIALGIISLFATPASALKLTINASPDPVPLGQTLDYSFIAFNNDTFDYVGLSVFIAGVYDITGTIFRPGTIDIGNIGSPGMGVPALRVGESLTLYSGSRIAFPISENYYGTFTFYAQGSALNLDQTITSSDITSRAVRTAPVPEPSSITLASLAVLGLSLGLRRQQKNRN